MNCSYSSPYYYSTSCSSKIQALSFHFLSLHFALRWELYYRLFCTITGNHSPIQHNCHVLLPSTPQLHTSGRVVHKRTVSRTKHRKGTTAVLSLMTDHNRWIVVGHITCVSTTIGQHQHLLVGLSTTIHTTVLNSEGRTTEQRKQNTRFNFCSCSHSQDALKYAGDIELSQGQVSVCLSMNGTYYSTGTSTAVCFIHSTATPIGCSSPPQKLTAVPEIQPQCEYHFRTTGILFLGQSISASVCIPPERTKNALLFTEECLTQSQNNARTLPNTLGDTIRMMTATPMV